MPWIGGAGASALGLGTVLLLAAPTYAQSRTSAEPFSREKLTPFQMRKAETLLREKLACLGCHALDGEGGRIGPSLSHLGGARDADYVRSVIADPEAALPGTLMPRVPMRPQTLDLIAGYLLQRDRATDPPPPLIERAPVDQAAARGDDGASLYAARCAVCHGARGDGDGPNAPHLPVRPAALSDSSYMSTRTDDALFDAIHAGGYVMGRSHLMPPFGGTLTRGQITALVEHVRTLCRCHGPAWSRDDR